MALIPIMGQPVNLVPNNERAFGCEPENSFCTLYKQSSDIEDFIFVQMEQTPCNPSIISNGNFADDEDWTFDTDVVIAQNKATHVVGVEGEISQDLSAVLVDTYHQIKVTVTGMSGGSIGVYFTQSGTPSATITENGIYTFYLYDLGDNDNLTFVFSSDCDASISEVAVFGLIDEATAAANATINTIDGVYVANMTATLIDEFIIYRITTAALEGCYNITIIDPCINFDELTEVFTDTTFDDAGEWTVGTDIGVTPDVSSGRFNDPADYWGKLSFAVQPFNIPTGVDLFMVAKVVTGTLFTGGTVSIKTENLDIVQFGGGFLAQNTTYQKALVVPSDHFDPTTLDMGIEHQAAWDTFFPTPTANSDYYPGVTINQFLEVSLKVAPVSQVSGVFFSNCIKVSTDVSGTQLVEGFADPINSFPAGNKSLGFMFLQGFFWLRARLSIQFSNPHSPIKTENYLYSSGRKKKAYAQVGKAWDLTFHAVDENMHDTIANIINCDQFTIEGNEYITDEKEYTANYGPKGVDPVGESTIEVQKIQNTRFNTNV